MYWQYQIWEVQGRHYHLAFHQYSMRIVYPPSHPLLYKPVQMAIKWYEGMGGKMVKQGAWRGDHIDEYLQIMRTLHPKALPTPAKTTEG